jgi:cytochrome P450
MRSFQRDPLTFLEKAAREYGDIVHFRLGPDHMYLLNHPDTIKDLLVTDSRKFHKGRALKRANTLLGNGLLTSEDEFHLRQRRLVQPAFHRQRLASYASVMADYAARTGERWQDGETVDVHQQMMRLTLAIVGKTLFDADVESEAEEIGEALTKAMQLFGRRLSAFGPLLDRLPLSINRRAAEARGRLDATIYRIIAEHRGSTDRGDLLSMLLQAQDTDGSAMTDRQVRDESMTLFLAGHETTANALTYMWHLLGHHPEAEARLHQEVDAVLGDRLPTFDDLPRLPYTRRVMAEAMRLYPPVWVVGRMALVDYPIGDYAVPAGAGILVSQWVMHHDPRYYPDPYRFDPDRWSPEAEASRPKFSYFPFSAGPRMCIGDQFAWTEGILVLATLARHWQLRPVPGFRLELRPLITLRPGNGLPMTLQRRRSTITMSIVDAEQGPKEVN